MKTYPVQLSDVIYNATSQNFEALVTVHAPRGPRKYACAINAPINMSYADAASGLATQALRRHAGRGGLSSWPNLVAAQARTRRKAQKPKRRLDPFALLRQLAA